MLAMVYLVPLGFALLVWNSYRARRAAGGAGFEPDGKLRWEQPEA